MTTAREADHDLLAEIRDNDTYAETEWAEIRKESKIDRQCVAGQPWQALDPDGVKERKEAKRPYLSSDELGQYLNQTVNDVRANPRGIKFAPTGNGANDQGAEFYQNHVREIEYRSHAPRVAYPQAFHDAVTSSYGWIRINTKREHIRTFDQNLFIEPIVNPDQILPDPSAVWPDSRDLTFLLQKEPWSATEFTRQYSKAKAASYSPELSKLAPGWIDHKRILVANYWKLETFTRTLVAYRPKGSQPGSEQMALRDELPEGKLPAGTENVREEDVDDTKVRCYLTNGLEILDEPKWAGRYIPFVSCFGKVLYVDEGAGSRRQILSMTRLARDPYMLYCYMVTCEAEAVGGIPRASWVGYEGQFAKPQRWQEATKKPVAYLEAKVSVPGNPTNSPLPLPQKQPWDPPLQNLEIAKEAARRAIQAAMGISPQPTDVQRRNDISGKAWERREAMSQKGAFHFVDHYDLMIERAGVILEDLISPVLDTARNVPARKGDDSAIIVRINDPRGSQLDDQGQVSGDPIFTKGDYRVTISTGPSNESQRDAASEFVDSMVTNLQTIAEIAGPPKAAMIFAKAIKLKQLGPIGDEIEALLAPPQPSGPGGKPLPPEAQALQAENQALKQQLQQAAQEKEAKVVEQQGKLEIVKYQTDARSQDAAADREVKLAVAELSAKVDRLALFLEESRAVGARAHEHRQSVHERLQDSVENAKDRAHERIQSEVEHQQTLDAADQAHQHALEQGDQGVAGQLKVQAAAPQPDNGSGA